MGVSAPSEQEYADQPGGDREYKLFPSDDYILEIVQLTDQPNKVDIFDKPKEGEPQRTYTGLEVRMRPISFANGDELQDEDGGDIASDNNPLFFDWLDPSKVGLKPQVAKARKFFAAALGIEVEDRIDIDQWSELIGKRLVGTVIIKTNGQGKRNNRLSSYRKVRTRRGQAATPAVPVDHKQAAAAKVSKAPVSPLPDDVTDEDDLPF